MSYDFEKDASAKSFEMKLDNDTIMTALITTDEEADGTLPELSDGVFGGIGFGPMSPDFEFLGSGGGSGDFQIVKITFINNSTYNFAIRGPFPYNGMLVNQINSADLGGDVDCVVYQDGTLLNLTSESLENIPNIEGSGNVQIQGKSLMVTGTCSITFSDRGV